MVVRSCWSAVRSRAHVLVDTEGGFSYSGLNRQMGSCSGAGQSQTVEFFAAECSGEQKYYFLLKTKRLVKQWSDASTNSGRFKVAVNKKVMPRKDTVCMFCLVRIGQSWRKHAGLK